MRELTEFERLVAGALKAQIDSTQGDWVYEEAFVDRIAPRVAAAIDADRFGEADEIARQRGAALRALRGKP